MPLALDAFIVSGSLLLKDPIIRNEVSELLRHTNIANEVWM